MEPIVLLLAIPLALGLTWISFYVAAHAVLAAWSRHRLAMLKREEDLADERAEDRLRRLGSSGR
jgi:hypothetical protein